MKNLNSALCRGIHWSLYFNIYQCLLLRFVTENIFISIERRKTLKIGNSYYSINAFSPLPFGRLFSSGITKMSSRKDCRT